MAPTSYSSADTAAAGIALPPQVWRADQLAAFRAVTLATGHAALDRELPDGGWPTGTLIELLVQQPGSGELGLLAPVLRGLSRARRIALVQPPHPLQVAPWIEAGIDGAGMFCVDAKRNADALWAAEQILRHGTVSALLFWQAHVRNESLRRLHLAAQSSDVAFWLLRPLASAQEASPAPLRLALRPANGAVRVDIVKRRGPRRDDPLFLPLPHLPAADVTLPESSHASVDQHSSSVAAARSVSSALV